LEVILKAGRDRSLRRRHPWLLSGAVDCVEDDSGAASGEAAVGAWACVRSADREVLGYGHYSPRSALRVRIVSFGKETAGEEACIAEAIGRAVALRAASAALIGPTDAVRLVNAEGDGLPGLVVDRYADTLCVKFTTAGMARSRDCIVAALRAATDAERAYERADGGAARREGFAPRDGVLWGSLPEPVAIRERERCYRVDVVHGQKTGFYLDQRDARDLVEGLAAGRRVLDLFSYSGAFAAAAARGGAETVTVVDSSADALDAARNHVEMNGAEGGRPYDAVFEKADGFNWLRACSERYGLLVVDPPPLARRKHDVEKATRAYKDVLLHAFRCAERDALVLAFSCSQHVGPDLFGKVVFGAALDAERPLQVLRELGAPADHPVSIDHPEGRYLSGLLLRVS
jgi:23S rRNA (cytosine1962-C5)-methyltransferase